MTLLDAYWPDYNEINSCIKSQAESVSDAVLLAVHQPTPLAIREVGSLSETAATEHDLLEAFLTDDLPEGTLLMPITGASGVGKSHIIRWLAAQLNRVKEERGLEIVRIPKSANLRTVVELILEPLSDDERYSKIRGKLENVIANVTPQDGATRFVAELKISLRNLSKQLLTQIKGNPGASGDRDLRVRLDHAQRLPDFFSDAELQKHFESNVLAPIIERSIRGKDIDVDDDDTLPQFSSDDLIVPTSLKLGNASIPVQTYYKTALASNDGKGREIAVDVLNSVIDEAIRRVFNLDQSINGVTLEDIILHVRALLFEDGRELVLLVEDFAVLSGIQEILLNVCIQEAVRDGKQIRSNMRTALAVTDGYLASRDTILTRAKREWIIQSSLDKPNDAMNRTINLVGSYLNAARWGEKELKVMFDESQRNSETGLTAWISTFDNPDKTTEESDLLTAFGTSDRGEPLFPFNRSAISALAEDHLMVSGQIVYDPRKVIDFVLRENLLQRNSFEQDRFPPPNFKNANPSADIASWITQASLAGDVRDRMKSLIVYWGGRPQTSEEVAAMPLGLFKAFGLPTPEDLGQPRVVPNVISPPKTPTVIAPKPSVESTTINEWRKKLDEWASGVRLEQTDANKLRKLITNTIEKQIDWNSLCLTRRTLKLMLVIPNARGNDAAAKHRINLADDHTDPSGVLRKTLLAVVCYESAGNTWNYQGGDEGSALLANLVENLTESLIPLLIEESDKETASLASILINQGRILGILPKRFKYPDARASVIVSAPLKFVHSDFPPESAEGKWEDLRQEAVQLRKDFRSQILDRIACFQGTGKTPFAIDVTKIPKEIMDDDDVLELPQALKGHVVKLKPNRLAARTKPLIKDIRTFYKVSIDALGDSLDKNALLDEFKELLEVTEAAGVWPEDAEFGKRKLKTALDTFRQTPLKDLLDQVIPLLDTDIDPSGDAVVDCLGRIDLNTLERSESFLKLAKAFIEAVERKVDMLTRNIQGINTSDGVKAIERKLDMISSDLQEIVGKGSLP